MKWIYKIATLCLFAFVIVSCAKHDFFDEMVITGDVAPESYWQDVSQVVKAGDSLSFNVQYYTNNSDSITHLEAWYSVTEKEEKSVSCPLITSFVFDMTSTENTVRRVSQMIRRYEHDPSCWSDSLHAYEMNGYIPVSSTLAPTTWPGIGAFDSLKMSQYFGAEYMQWFKDSLNRKINFAYTPYMQVFQSTGLISDTTFIKQITDSTWNANTLMYEKTFKHQVDTVTGKSVIQPWIVDTINNLWEQVQFVDLISKAGVLSVSYKSSYSLNAELRIYNNRGIYSKTEPKDVVVN